MDNSNTNLYEENLKETEILGKKIGNGIKSHIKEQNSTYIPCIKEKITSGLEEYYKNLTSNISNELQSQESIQKSLIDEIEKVRAETDKAQEDQKRNRQLQLNIKIKNYESKLKSRIFRYLVLNNLNAKQENKLESQLIYNRIHVMKRSIFDLLKRSTCFKPKKVFDNNMKLQTENDLKKYEDTQKNEKDELIKLIYQAEEKLKHENKRKIQTKLLLDQIVLRGVSAINLHALNLSNSSLKGNYFKLI